MWHGLFYKLLKFTQAYWISFAMPSLSVRGAYGATFLVDAVLFLFLYERSNNLKHTGFSISSI